MKQPEVNLNKRQGCAIIVIATIIILFVMGKCAGLDDDIKEGNAINSTKQTDKQWKDMNYEEHEAWINNYMDKPDDNGYALIGYTIDEIKQKIQYPKTVSFDINPSFNKDFRNIAEADSGLVFFYGKGTAENSFGVPIGFKYSVKWKITPDELKILEITVNEDK